MNIVTVVRVQPHRLIQPDIEGYLPTLGDTPQAQAAGWRAMWKEFKEMISAGKGTAAGAVFEAGTRLPTYWCSFPGGGMAQCVIQPDESTGWFTVERRVIVTSLVFPGLGSPDGR